MVHLNYCDADPTHGAEAASVLQLLRRMGVHLHLLLLDRRRDPQEVCWKLSDVHLDTERTHTGPERSSTVQLITLQQQQQHVLTHAL